MADYPQEMQTMQSLPQGRGLAAKSNALSTLAVPAELALTLLAAHEAHYLRFNSWVLPSYYLNFGITIALISAFSLALVGAYTPERGRTLGNQLLRVIAGWLITIGVASIIVVSFKISTAYSRLWFTYTVAIAVLQIVVVRIAWAVAVRRLRSLGRNLRGIVLIELPNTPHRMNARLDDLRRYGYRMLGRITLALDQDWAQDLDARVTALGAQEVWICLPIEQGDLVKPIAVALRYQTVEIRYFPELRNIPLLNHKIHNIAGLAAVDISCSPMTWPNRLIKRMEDLVIGALIALLILPVCLAIALAVRLSSRGPIVFKQRRLGFNGQEFNVYKFRSMEVHTENQGHVTQAQFGDPRITPLGAFLRRTSLDELPQFFNVLRGDMSIVGPRPHALAHNEQYKSLVQSYMKRHKVKPGITGWAQVNGYRGVTDTLDKMEKRVECDLWYINNWSLWLDLRIIFWTVFKGFMNQQP